MSHLAGPLDEHVSEMTGLLFLEGELEATGERQVSARVSLCGECRSLLQALQREDIWLRESLAADEEAIPARLARLPGRPVVAPWAWITATGMSAGGAYTVWSGLVAPWAAQASEAGFTQGNLLATLFFSGTFWKGWDAMQDGIEFLAMATLGVFFLWMLRRQWKRLSVAGLILPFAAVLALLAAPSPAAAAEVQHGDPSYTLPAGQEVKSDLIVAAQRTRIDGDVDGDLIVFSRSLTVNGHVKGDVLAFGQEVRVNGPVEGNVRAFCQSLTLDGSVGKNVMSWSREMYMDEKARVGGTMTLGAANAQIDGHLNGDLLGIGDLEINGSLGHDATIRGGRLRIGPTASIAGQTKYRGGRQPEIASGAQLGSPIEILERRRPGPQYASPRYYWRQILAWAASLLFGIMLFLIAPAFFADVENASKRFGASIGLGLLLIFAIPIASIIACFTVVGLGVGIASILLYLLALYSAQVFVGEWLGEQLLGAGIGTAAIAGRLALGLGILRLLRIIPFLGGLAGFIIVLWGLGALALAIYKKVRPQFAPAAAI